MPDNNKKVIDIRVKIGENSFKSFILTQYAPKEFDFYLNTGSWTPQTIDGVSCFVQTITQDISGTPISINSTTEGVISIAMDVNPNAYTEATKAKLRCVEQGNNFLKMAAFGPVPTQQVKCHVTNVYNPL